MKSKKILIIVIILIVILGLGGATFAYLFMATDIFKSNKELFAKYMSQNIEDFQSLGDLKTIQTYKDLANQGKYESNTDIKMTYSEGGEVSNPVNNLSANLDVQKDNENEYFYADGQILFNEEEYLESEIIKDKELYGIRFSDVAKQFVSIKNDEKIEDIADEIGIDSSVLEKIINIIDGTAKVSEEIISQDDAKTLKEKYSNMITKTISEGTFSKQRNAMITYNNNKIKTNSYTVSLTNTQVEKLLEEILNNIKNESVIVKNIKNESFGEQIDELVKVLTDEKELPAIKITVFEQNKSTIRTVVEIGGDKIIIENAKGEGERTSKIQFTKIVSEKTNKYDIELTKKTMENKEDVSINVNVEDGEENYTVSLSSEMQLTDDNIETNILIGYKKDILSIKAELYNAIDFTNDFEERQTLLESNNLVLSDMEQEKRKTLIDILKENVPIKTETRVELLKEALGLSSNTTTEEPVSEAEMTQVEINKFNAKFEFYTGNEVTPENVKALLNIVKNNLGSCEITPAEGQENTEEMDPEDVKYVIKLNIERNSTNEDEMNQVLDMISDEKKYQISISYKEENKLIDYITIEEVEN